MKDFATFDPRNSQEAITRTGLQNSASHLIAKGTLITSTRMALGKAVIYEVDVAINQDLKALFPRPVLAMQYLYFWFQYHRQSIDELGSGSTVKGISLPDLKKIEFPLPPLPEQEAIAAILSDMDTEIAALETKLAKTRSLKKGMMQELLTGRTRLIQGNRVVESDREKVFTNKRHNWEFNEAVVISALASKFGNRKYPLGRMRYTKLSYLMHRYVERSPTGYLKKAAGPYNPSTRYKGPEAIAKKRGYVEFSQTGDFSGFVSGQNIDQALAYFNKWYGEEALAWLEQFRYEKKENLELLATVDMANQELGGQGTRITIEAVKDVLRSDPEWKPKLEREIFSDANIEQAIKRCQTLFGEE